MNCETKTENRPIPNKKIRIVTLQLFRIEHQKLIINTTYNFLSIGLFCKFIKNIYAIIIIRLYT